LQVVSNVGILAILEVHVDQSVTLIAMKLEMLVRIIPSMFMSPGSLPKEHRGSLDIKLAWV